MWTTLKNVISCFVLSDITLMIQLPGTNFLFNAIDQIVMFSREKKMEPILNLIPKKNILKG